MVVYVWCALQVAFSILLPPFFLIFPYYNQRVYKERERENTPFVSWAMSEDLGALRRGNLRGWPPSSLSPSSCLTRAPFFPVFLDRTRRPFKMFSSSSFKQNKASSCLLSPSATVYIPKKRGAVEGEDFGVHKTANTLLWLVLVSLSLSLSILYIHKMH